ncbi:MAG: FAD-binding oxidoreductase [Phycisphaerae bacterium]|nr:FAD-binding oxidoreductase [Phycisphaerae bacterium]
MSTTYDVIIVGAGIVGCACAHQCSQAGLKVLILDQGPVGGQSTGAGMGHIVTMDDSPDQLALTHYARRLWLELAEDLPAHVEFQRCGTLWVAADAEELDAVKRKVSVYQSAGSKAQVLDARTLHEEEPHLNPAMLGGLLIPEDAVLYPPNAARYLVDRARSFGAELRTGVAVRQIGDKGSVTLGDGSSVEAGLILNAAGCGAPALTPHVPVRPRKGHLVVTHRYPGFVRHQMIELGYLKSAHSVSSDSVAFNVQPRATGQILIGSSRQYGDDSQTIHHGLLSRMMAQACHYMPEIGALSVTRTWVGFRPATPDKRPLIGPSLVSDKVWLATGHEGLGIATSLATGRLVADMIVGRTPEIPIAPYSPARVTQENVVHE